MQLTRMIGLVLVLVGGASAAAAPEHAAASFMADTSAVRPGQPFRVGVLLKIEPGWHVYWLNPGDAGLPTTVTLHLPEGFTASPMQYPLPKRFTQPGDITGYGYPEEVMLIATITPPANVAKSDVEIGAEVTWLVCENVCIPGSAKLSMKLPVGDSAQAKDRAMFDQWMARMPISIGQAKDIARHSESVGEKRVSIAIDWKDEAPRDIEWFPPPGDAVTFSDVRIQTEGKTTRITAAFERMSKEKVGLSPVASLLAYTVGTDRHGVVIPVELGSPGRSN